MSNDKLFPHPHLDPTHPQAGSLQRTNPPVFVWKPDHTDQLMNLVVARDETLKDRVIEVKQLTDPMYLPDKILPSGKYFWQWSDQEGRSPVYDFEITPDAVNLEVPSVDVWLHRFPQAHPRIFTRPEMVSSIRQSCKDESRPDWTKLRSFADQLLLSEHETEEPPFLPDRRVDYDAFFKVWYKIMWGTRQFAHGAYTLALAYLAGDDIRYGRAACRRMASIARWDPEGSSFLGHNDEAHMSVIWHGPQACDWVWEVFTDEEREQVIQQYRTRGRITFEHMRNKGYYGITRFDSHAGREIVFLALTALVFHEHIPEAESWLTWLRPILCGVWPIWGQDDGGWAEGMSYSNAYVDIMTMFATALKRGANIDLYKRPFWRNHARWRQYCWPPYAEWIGFGDHSERWKSAWERNADLVELIGRETETEEFNAYIASFREEAKQCYTPPERDMPGVSAQLFLHEKVTPHDTSEQKSVNKTKGGLQVFSDVGWAVIRTNLRHADQDIAFLFRSSPYGAISHSHANNNDFIIHAGGKVLAMPSGYYSGYGSDHHAHWVWHTKSHNCLTLSDAPQLMRSHHSRGYIDHIFEDERLIYFRGVADASYQDRATRCRRHVCFFKQHTCFLLVDEYIARWDVVSALQWNIHSRVRFEVDEQARSFLIEREGSSLTGHMLYSHNGYFLVSEGWDPPPSRTKPNDQWYPQYHLRFTPSGMESNMNLGVLLCPGHANLKPATIKRERIDGLEAAFIEEDAIYIRQHEKIDTDTMDPDALILLRLAGKYYHIDDHGVK